MVLDCMISPALGTWYIAKIIFSAQVFPGPAWPYCAESWQKISIISWHVHTLKQVENRFKITLIERVEAHLHTYYHALPLEALLSQGRKVETLEINGHDSTL